MFSVVYCCLSEYDDLCTIQYAIVCTLLQVYQVQTHQWTSLTVFQVSVILTPSVIVLETQWTMF